MNIKEKLKQLAHYYDVTRQVGHTTLMLEGAKNTKDCIVVTHNQVMGESVQQMANQKVKTVSLSSPNLLRGFKKPIVFDNCALYVLFLESVREMDRLEEENKKLKKKLAA
jgi:chemotaxis protein CheY-P-specific phosphatase CheC